MLHITDRHTLGIPGQVRHKNVNFDFLLVHDSPLRGMSCTGTKHGTGDVPPNVRHEVSPTRPGSVGDGVQADHGKATLRGTQQLRFR